MIKLNVTPQQITEDLPYDFLENISSPEDGFSDKEYKIDEDEDQVTFSLSYDGESELLIEVTDNPKNYDEDKIKSLIAEYFAVEA
jgi:hypothetical protein